MYVPRLERASQFEPLILLIYARTAEHISDFLTLQWGGFVARLYTLGSSGELVEAQEKPFLDETSDMEDFEEIRRLSKFMSLDFHQI